MKKKILMLPMILCLSLVVFAQSILQVQEPNVLTASQDSCDLEKIAMKDQENADDVSITLDVKVFMEGPYFSGQMTPFINVLGFLPVSQPYNTSPWLYDGPEAVPIIPSFNIIDWILVDLLEPINPENGEFSLIGRQAGFVLNNGTVKNLDGISNLIMLSPDTSGFYLRINHRNHLAVISSDSLINNSGTYSWDFTIGANQAVGGEYSQNEIEPGVWGMISGNGDANNQIDNLDKNEVWRVEQNGFGYFAGDYDMDCQVSEDDIVTKWSLNVGKGISNNY